MRGPLFHPATQVGKLKHSIFVGFNMVAYFVRGWLAVNERAPGDKGGKNEFL